MAFIDHTNDEILLKTTITAHGRENIAKYGRLMATKFSASDDGMDYSILLMDSGSLILERLPLLESNSSSTINNILYDADNIKYLPEIYSTVSELNISDLYEHIIDIEVKNPNVDDNKYYLIVNIPSEYTTYFEFTTTDVIPPNFVKSFNTLDIMNTLNNQDVTRLLIKRNITVKAKKNINKSFYIQIIPSTLLVAKPININICSKF